MCRMRKRNSEYLAEKSCGSLGKTPWHIREEYVFVNVRAQMGVSFWTWGDYKISLFRS